MKLPGRSILSVLVTALVSGCSGMLDIPVGERIYTLHEDGTRVVNVILKRQPTDDVDMTVSSSDPGEATVSPASLTFTNGNWNVPQPLTITGEHDLIEDGNQRIQIIFGAATSSDPSYDGYIKKPLDVKVIDIDQASVTVTPTSGLVTSETGGQATFDVVLSSKPTDNVTVPTIASNDSTEGTVDKASLTFTPTNYYTPQTVTITGQDDALEDGDIAYGIILGNSESLDSNYDNLNVSNVSVTNQDNDTPGVEVTNMSNETTETGIPGSFDVRLESQPLAGNQVVIRVNEANDPLNDSNQEGTVDKATLTFDNSNWDVYQTVTVTPADEDIADGNVQYVIALEMDGTTDDPNYVGLEPDDVTVNNLDNDVAGFVIVADGTTQTSNSSVTVGGFATDDMNNMGDTHATFTIRLRSEPLGNVTLDLSFSTADDGRFDGATTTKVLTFTPSDWDSAQTVRVEGHSDGTNEGNRSYSINVGVSSDSADPDERYGDTSFVKAPSFGIYSCDNDASNLLVSCRKSGTLNTTEGGGTASFWIIGQSDPGCTVTVPLSSSDTGEGVIVNAPAEAYVTGSNYDRLDDGDGQNLVTIQGVDDATPDGAQSYTIVLGISTGCVNFDPEDMTAYNADDEQILDVVKTGDTSEDGTTADYRIKLKNAPTDSVTFSVSCGSDECSSLSESQLTFTSSDWNTYQNVTVTPVDDNEVDGNASQVISFGQLSSYDPYFDLSQPPGVSSMSNIDNDRLIWITNNTYLGNFNASSSMNPIDAQCSSSAADANAPPNVGSVTYRALIGHGSYRRATTDGSTDAGQTGWVLLPDTEYYLKTGGTSYSSTHLFTTDHYGLFPFGTLDNAFSGFTGDEFWTGFNADWTTNAANCSNWSDDDGYSGAYGRGGETDSDAIYYGTASCAIADDIRKRIICVQQ